VCRADNLTTFFCRLSRNLGASTSWNPDGLSRPVQGLIYLFIYILPNVQIVGFCDLEGFVSNKKKPSKNLTVHTGHVVLLILVTVVQTECVFKLPFINPLKTKHFCFIQGLSAYRAVNTLHFGYKNQSLNVL
jgi:hypothetical protein